MKKFNEENKIINYQKNLRNLEIIRISPEELHKRREINEIWLSSMTSLIENFFSKIKKKDFFISFIDSEGVVLKIICLGEGKGVFTEGTVVKEEFFGKTAVSLSLENDKNIEVVGQNHTFPELKEWACAASPIHDSTGNICGLISFTSKVEDYPDYALGIVSSLSQAVEKEVKWKEISENLKLSKKYLDIISEGIKDGILCLDKEAKILYMNDTAGEILRVDPKKSLGRFVGDIVDFDPVILSVYKTHKGYTDREFIINSPHMGTLHFIKSAVIVRDEEGKFAGVIDFFREINRVRKFVTSYIGAQAKFSFTDIIGNSPKLKEAIRIAKIASKSNSNVLILGKTGTGKEMFAQAIHYEGLRRKGPFVVINCGAIPRELAESELFGYEPGSFTGADRRGRPGKFELANGGTIFLDEIGELPLDLQVKLLRVLQEKSVTRIGGARSIPVDVRVIAASNKDLSKEVDNGNFRADLYHRLNVIQINIPPLSERNEDIPLLIHYFVEKLSQKLQKNIVKIGDSFYNPLLAYSFPGNVRELENIIERALNICDGNELNQFHLPDIILKNDSLYKSIDKFKRDSLIQTLQNTKWNISKTSKILGISRPTVYNHIKKWDIKKLEF
ncbi:MAG TPA: sigma-54-dependent Fis family transcriptional regulator [Candidatus Atribacteria bacterium]|nr:sigma-54-dependent Fis family transcriptional regulator [Candidatus Atribacteria bacterium]